MAPGIELSHSVPEDLWAVAGDPESLRQAVMNLCVNAREAMAGTGAIEIIAENLPLKDGDPRLRHGGRPGLHVVITVADKGCGIPPQNLERIFTPFFTTKDHGQSVGVGLTAVQAIARAHGGFVTVDSEVGRGSRFRIYLPATTGAPASNKPEPRRSFPRGNGECILLVDDEAGFREITQVTLEKYGYRVITASDGVVSTLDTNGEQLGLAATTGNPDDQPLIRYRPFTAEDYDTFPDGHGTVLTLTIPEKDIDPESGEAVEVTPLPDYPAPSRRSEEHTSELQSH